MIRSHAVICLYGLAFAVIVYVFGNSVSMLFVLFSGNSTPAQSASEADYAVDKTR